MTFTILFYILLLVVAFLYATVGHGGASGYLALMALFSIAPEVMKPTALVINIFVSCIAFVQFYKAKHFIWALFLPLAAVSIPMSFIGGLMVVNGVIYKRMLGVLLIFPILRFFLFKDRDPDNMKPFKIVPAMLIGAVIGLLSGMIGMGGGILLSPILLLLGWTNQKQTAAISALFIFVNSIAGLIGQLSKGIHFSAGMVGYVVVALVGGVAGSYLGAKKFDQVVLKRFLASVLVIAVIKLFTT